MYAAIFPSDMPQTIPPALAGIRVSGGVDIGFACSGGKTRIERLREWDGYRVRFPNVRGTPEAVIVNTGGGVAGGDEARFSVSLAEEAQAAVTTPSAEKVYGALGGSEAHIETIIALAENAKLSWLPQETILFDRARLKRLLTADIAASATLLISETVIFGRAAMGETVSEGSFTERWRIRRDGRLIFAENATLAGDIAGTLALPAVAGGAHAVSLSLLAAPDAEERLSAVRQALEYAECAAAASAWNGVLAIRALGESGAPVRRMLEAVLPILSGNNMPRNWQT